MSFSKLTATSFTALIVSGGIGFSQPLQAQAAPSYAKVELVVPILEFDDIPDWEYYGDGLLGATEGDWVSEWDNAHSGNGIECPQSIASAGVWVDDAWEGDKPSHGTKQYLITYQSRDAQGNCEFGGTTYADFPRRRDGPFVCPPGTGSAGSLDGPRIDYKCRSDETATVSAVPNPPPLREPGACPLNGNPCNAATGDKSLIEVDYASPVLSFVRYYHSANPFVQGNPLYAGTRNQPKLGRGWSHSYSSYLLTAGGNVAGAVRENGYLLPLKDGANISGQSGKFIAADGSGIVVTSSGTDYILHLPDGSTELYDSNGKLLSLTATNGQQTLLEYDPTLVTILKKVTGPYGHSIELEYDSANQYVESVEDPNGNLITYGHVNDNLTTVTYQDAAIRTYHYEDTTFVGHLTGITDENNDRYADYSYDSIGRVTDSEHDGYNVVNQVFNGDGTTTVTLGTGLDAVAKEYDFGTTDYANPWSFEARGQTFSTLEDAIAHERANNGHAASVHFVPAGYSGFTFGSDQYRKPEAVTIDSQGRTLSFLGDYARRIDSITDENGVVTKYGYDNGLGGTDYFHKTSVIEGFGSSTPRETEYEYLEPESQLKSKITEPSVSGGANRRVTEITYYPGTKNVHKVTEKGFKQGGAALADRVTEYTYINGQVTSIDGPRNDVTTITYHTCTTGAECGQVHTVTNAVGHVTTFSDYYADGRVWKMTNPRGIETTITYDLRGRVNTITEDPQFGTNRVIDYDYDDVGQIDKITFPNGLVLDYEWKAAHLLEWVEDNADNRIDYEYDTRGNQTDADIQDSSLVVQRAMAMAYDARDRIESLQAGTAGIDVRYDFDALGNLLSIKDDHGAAGSPVERTASILPDALNRPDTSTDAQSLTTDYAFDVQDNLTEIKIPKSGSDTVDTSYEYDDFGNLLKEDSPDRGVTLYAYDNAGNMTCRLDGRHSTGITDCATATGRVEFFYDAINRLTDIKYPSDPTQDVKYWWDYYSKPGDLVQVTFPDPNRTDLVVNQHNHYGDRTSQLDYINNGSGGSEVLNTKYAYSTTTHDLEKITYPKPISSQTDEREVTYERDTQGRVVGITATFKGNSYTIIDNSGSSDGVEYEPFGPVKKIVFGNGVEQEWIYDDGYRIDQITVKDASSATLLDWDYTLDEAGNVQSIDRGAYTDGFTYDVKDRLSTNNYGSYAYDGNGNMLHSFYSSPYIDLTFENGSNPGASKSSNRISTRGSVTVNEDGMGNVLDLGTGVSFTYDEGGRLETLTSNGQTIANQYNGYGERSYTHRTMSASERYVEYYTYAPDGKLLTFVQSVQNTDDTLGIRTVYQYVWLDDIPVAQFREQYQSDGTYIDSGSQLVYIHADHLFTPRMATGTSEVSAGVFEDDIVVWSTFGYDYGQTIEFSDPDADLETVNIALRFPGQVYYGIGTFNYNYYRDYEAFYGRYLESDPIGLTGGRNSYAYASGNPLRYMDPYGLWALGDPLPQGFVNAVTGFGDGISLFDFSPSRQIREGWGIGGAVDVCSAEYLALQEAGEWYTLLFPVGARLGYISRIAQIPKSATTVKGAFTARVAIRNEYRSIFRPLFTAIGRDPTLATIEVKAAQKGAAYAIQRAGVASPKWNAVILGVPAVGAIQKTQ